MLFSHPSTSRLALLTVIVAVFVVIPQTALPYEIGPRKRVHETLTLLASDCLRRVPLGKQPSICLPSPAAVMEDKALEDAAVDFKSPKLKEVSAKKLAEAVKWPDDPTREVGVWTIFKFGVKLLGQCEKRYKEGLEHGLLCSSHHGPLQFWHAMASCPKEPTVETQRKMLAWAQFLYEVINADDAKLKEDYCEYWQKQQKNGNGELASILAPKGGFPCTLSEKKWTISTLFSMTCERPFSSQKCTEWLHPQVARVNALGALLHMVQDSYAQGHASRGSAELNTRTGRVKSKFECLPIKQFYTYSEQDAKKHRQADAPPQPGHSCAGASTCIDDPILASATVLWFVQQQKDSAVLTEYLRNRVFDLTDIPEPHAGVGEHFLKKISQPHADVGEHCLKDEQ